MYDVKWFFMPGQTPIVHQKSTGITHFDSRLQKLSHYQIYFVDTLYFNNIAICATPRRCTCMATAIHRQFILLFEYLEFDSFFYCYASDAGTGTHLGLPQVRHSDIWGQLYVGCV